MQFQQQGQRTAGSRTKKRKKKRKKKTDGGGRPDLTGDTPHLGWGAVPNQTWTGSGSTKNPPRWVTAGDSGLVTHHSTVAPVAAPQWLPSNGRGPIPESRLHSSEQERSTVLEWILSQLHNPGWCGKIRTCPEGRVEGRRDRHPTSRQANQPARFQRQHRRCIWGWGVVEQREGASTLAHPLPLLSFTPASFSPW